MSNDAVILDVNGGKGTTMTSPKQREDGKNRAGLCVMPWINMHVTTDGKIAPCCEYEGSLGTLAETTMQEAWQGDALKEIRRKFVEGEKVDGCWKCFDREASEGNSMRFDKNRSFSPWHKHLVQHVDLMNAAPDSPVALDLRFSNLCNFKCRSCWHGASSKWFTDGKAIGVTAGDKAEIRSFRSINEVVEQIGPGIDTLEEVYFAGGEPLIMEEHYALLRLLCDRNQTHVRLSYNTNLSVTRFAGQCIFDLWARFDSIGIDASVDATGGRGAYVRSGFKWTTFVNNLNELKRKCPHAKLRFGITVSALNILSLPDLFRALEQECGASPDQFFLHSLQDPIFYRTQILPTHLKHRATDGIETYIAEVLEQHEYEENDGLQLFVNSARGLVNYMSSADLTGEIDAMRKLTDRLDELRDEDISQALPELDTLLDTQPWWQRQFFALKRLVR